METLSAHAQWWDAELKILWPQAAMVLGDKIAHSIVWLATGRGDVDSSVFMIDHPFVRTDTESVHADMEKLPSVRPGDGGTLYLEIPAQAAYTPFGVRDRLHHVMVRGLQWLTPAPVPAEYKVSFGFNANPSADDSGLDVLVQSEIRFDLPDWVKALTGLWQVERLMNDARSPFLAGLNTVIEGLTTFDTHPIPSFRQWRYDRIPLAPDRVRPRLLQPHLRGLRPENGGRLDWWDIVFVADGFDPADTSQFDELVGRGTHGLTGSWPVLVGTAPAMIPTDPGANLFASYRSVIRTWQLSLEHTSPAITARESDQGGVSAFSNLAVMAEVGLLMEQVLSSEYPGSHRVPNRTTYVIVRGVPPSDTRRHRAMGFGNFVLLPLRARDDGMSTARTPENQARVLIHELGHLRHAQLADEYNSRRGVPDYQGPEPAQVNISREAAPDKWARFGASVTGVEGAYEYDRGIFRPTMNCRMRRGASLQAFCPVCSDAVASGLLAHMGHGVVGVRAPLSVSVDFEWPFSGTWQRTVGAKIGAAVPPGNLSMPYLEDRAFRSPVRVAAHLSIERAGVPADATGAWTTDISDVNARPHENLLVDERHGRMELQPGR